MVSGQFLTTYQIHIYFFSAYKAQEYTILRYISLIYKYIKYSCVCFSYIFIDQLFMGCHCFSWLIWVEGVRNLWVYVILGIEINTC